MKNFAHLKIQISDLQHFNANYENYDNVNIGEHNLRADHAPLINIWFRPLKLFYMSAQYVGEIKKHVKYFKDVFSQPGWIEIVSGFLASSLISLRPVQVCHVHIMHFISSHGHHRSGSGYLLLHLSSIDPREFSFFLYQQIFPE